MGCGCSTCTTRPWWMTAMQSALRIVLSLWAITTTERPGSRLSITT